MYFLWYMKMCVIVPHHSTIMLCIFPNFWMSSSNECQGHVHCTLYGRFCNVDITVVSTHTRFCCSSQWGQGSDAKFQGDENDDHPGSYDWGVLWKNRLQVFLLVKKWKHHSRCLKSWYTSPADPIIFWEDNEFGWTSTSCKVWYFGAKLPLIKKVCI